MSLSEPSCCVTCGAVLDPKRLTCAQCEEFTPRMRTLMVRCAIAFAVFFVPTLLFLVALTLHIR